MVFGMLVAVCALIAAGPDRAIAHEAHQKAKAGKADVSTDINDLHADEASVEHGRIENPVETPTASLHSHSDHESNESTVAG